MEISVAVRKESTKYLEKLFGLDPSVSSTVVVDHVLSALKTLRTSSIDRDREVFDCFMKDIIFESIFFPSYPLDIFMNFVCLFAGIIEHRLVSEENQALDSMHNFLLDILKEKPKSKMFYFGVMVLNQIKHVLHEHREFCRMISLLDNFRNLHIPSTLIECVNSVIRVKKTVTFREPNICTVLEFDKYAEPITCNMATVGRNYTKSCVWHRRKRSSRGNRYPPVPHFA